MVVITKNPDNNNKPEVLDTRTTVVFCPKDKSVNTDFKILTPNIYDYNSLSQESTDESLICLQGLEENTDRKTCIKFIDIFTKYHRYSSAESKDLAVKLGVRDSLLLNFKNFIKTVQKSWSSLNDYLQTTTSIQDSSITIWKPGRDILQKYLATSMYIRVLRRTTILYAGSMVFAIAICVTFLLPQETKKFPPAGEYKLQEITLQQVIYLILRILQICGPLLLAIGTLMLALGCCSKTLEHPSSNFADTYEENLHNDGVSIASDEDIELAEQFRKRRGEGIFDTSFSEEMSTSDDNNSRQVTAESTTRVYNKNNNNSVTQDRYSLHSNPISLMDILPNGRSIDNEESTLLNPTQSSIESSYSRPRAPNRRKYKRQTEEQQELYTSSFDNR